MFKKTILFFPAVLFSALVFAKTAVATGEVIMYMADHEAQGQVVVNNPKKAKYYRVLVQSLGQGKYLVQDFYISKKKLTEPYVLIQSKLKYVFNEDNSQSKTYPRDGKRIVWYESGAKAAETNYRNGREDGLWVEWYENGQKSSESKYVLGKPVGTWRTWDEEGNKTSEETH